MSQTKKPSYLQISPPTFELWVKNPCTQALLNGIEYQINWSIDEIGSGNYFIPGNHEETISHMAFQFGVQEAYRNLSNVKDFFIKNDLFIENEEK